MQTTIDSYLLDSVTGILVEDSDDFYPCQQYLFYGCDAQTLQFWNLTNTKGERRLILKQLLQS